MHSCPLPWMQPEKWAAAAKKPVWDKTLQARKSPFGNPDGSRPIEPMDLQRCWLTFQQWIQWIYSTWDDQEDIILGSQSTARLSLFERVWLAAMLTGQFWKQSSPSPRKSNFPKLWQTARGFTWTAAPAFLKPGLLWKSKCQIGKLVTVAWFCWFVFERETLTAPNVPGNYSFSGIRPAFCPSRLEAQGYRWAPARPALSLAEWVSCLRQSICAVTKGHNR